MVDGPTLQWPSRALGYSTPSRSAGFGTSVLLYKQQTTFEMRAGPVVIWNQHKINCWEPNKVFIQIHFFEYLHNFDLWTLGLKIWNFLIKMTILSQMLVSLKVKRIRWCNQNLSGHPISEPACDQNDHAAVGPAAQLPFKVVF